MKRLRGTVYCAQGSYEEAFTKYEKLLKIKLLLHAHNLPEVAKPHNKIGKLWPFHQGQNEETISMYEKLPKIQLSLLDSNRPEIAKFHDNIGLIYFNQGKYGMAISMHEKSPQIR
ncbi:hypothetical protein TrispH2_006077 [Trichoplax sp. H2]|nr:hypothetical protein TrispH2_006077 [Trichoplax sp. H2]|eukprot:RDD43108.1 hypothetical protein TrispH2_006077 [Trichoplax sp. H2]